MSAPEMSAAQFRDAIEQLETTQLGIADLLGVDGRTARRWASEGEGARDVPNPVARFLRYLISKKQTAAKALKTLGE